MSNRKTVYTILRTTFVSLFIATIGLFGLSQPVLAACNGTTASNVVGIPPWYKYLPNDDKTSEATGRCVPGVDSFDDFLLIALAVIEIMLRVITYIAITMFIYGAIRMIISQGSPDEVKKSRDTVTNAVVGLAIALIATGIVNFVGRTLG